MHSPRGCPCSCIWSRAHGSWHLAPRARGDQSAARGPPARETEAGEGHSKAQLLISPPNMQPLEGTAGDVPGSRKHCSITLPTKPSTGQESRGGTPHL